MFEPKFIGVVENTLGNSYDFYQQIQCGVMHFALVRHGDPAPKVCPYADISWLFRQKCISKY